MYKVCIMRVTLFSLVMMACVLTLTHTAAESAPEASTEYQLKAAYIYNFLKFVEWPANKTQDPNIPVIIGILGEDKFENSFDVLKEKEINGRHIAVKRFTSMARLMSSKKIETVQDHPQMDVIKSSHLLFICTSEENYVEAIVQQLEGNSILMVGDTDGFLQLGVVINLFMDKDQKVRFGINTTAAERAELKLRAKLLRLAKVLI